MTTEETAEQLELEERAYKIRRAVLSNAKFMSGLRRSQQEELAGECKQWADVKRELRI